MIRAAEQPVSWLPVTLLVFVLVTSVAGCGLKGDLYLTEPGTDKSQAAEVSEAGDPLAPQSTDGAAESQGKEPEPEAEELSDATSELVNSAAAMDADPAASVIEPDEGGDAYAELSDSESPEDNEPETETESDGAVAPLPANEPSDAAEPAL